MKDYFSQEMVRISSTQTDSTITLYRALIPQLTPRLLRCLEAKPERTRLEDGRIISLITHGGVLPFPFISSITYSTKHSRALIYWRLPVLFSFIDRQIDKVALAFRKEGINPRKTWIADALELFLDKEERGETVEDIAEDDDVNVCAVVRATSTGMYNAKQGRKL